MNIKILTSCTIPGLMCGLVLSGCRMPKVMPSTEDTVVYVLFDASGSTNSAQVRQSYLSGLGTIEAALVNHGGVIRGDVIGSEALNTSTVPINVAFPVYNQITSNDRTQKRQIDEASDLLNKQTKRTMSLQQATSRTAIMSSLEVAGKIFNGDQFKNSKTRILVIFSDMVEESPHYNFTRERLSDERIQQIVNAERAAGSLPDLHGVRVWKAGASAGHLSDDRSRELQSFWVQYFKAAGASLEPNHYGPSLFSFSLN